MFKFSLHAALQLNTHLMFLWGRMDMNAKLRNIKWEFHCLLYGACGSVVVKALCCKLEGRGFYTR
jgi:hypothetical protein